VRHLVTKAGFNLNHALGAVPGKKR